MRRHRTLAVLAVLVAACSPALPTPIPTLGVGPWAPPAAVASKLADPVRACRDPQAFETPLPSGIEPIDLYDSAYSPGDGIPGGALTIGVIRAPRVFDPFRASDPRDTLLTQAIWSGLVFGTNDYKWEPDLASVVPTAVNRMVEINGKTGSALDGSGPLSGPMSVLWCLRPGSTWSDGVPLTCADFQFTAHWLVDVASDPRRNGPLSRVECPDPAVMIARYDAPFEAYIAHSPMPLPAHVLGSIQPDELQPEALFSLRGLMTLPSSGAFHVTTTDASTFELSRNGGYRGGHRGAPAYLDTLTIRAYPSRDALVRAFQDGAVQLATDVAWTDIASLEGAGLHDSIAAAPGFAYDTLRFNLSTPVAGDAAIRTALAHVIDAGAARLALLPPDDGQPAATVVAPQAWYYLDLPPFTPSREAALGALASGGWALDASGALVRTRDDQPARLRLCSIDDPPHRAASGIVERAAATLGIEVRSTFVDVAQVTAPFGTQPSGTPCVVADGEYDIALMPLDSFLEPLDFRLRYHAAFFEPAGLNDGRVSIDAINDALDQVAGTVDFVTVKDAMQAFQQAMRDNVVELPLDVRKDVALVRTEKSPGHEAMQNFFQNSPAGPPTWNAEDWFIKP